MTGHDLKLWRARLAWSQHDLATALGLTAGAVARWEQTGRMPSWLPLALVGIVQRETGDLDHLDAAKLPTAFPGLPQPQTKRS